MRRLMLVFVMLAELAFGRLEAVRFLRWNQTQPIVGDVTDSKQWDNWIRQRDYEIRSGIERCMEDSTSMLILFGTSFTTLPRLTSPMDAVTAAGDLTPAARLRMDAFINGVDQIDDERFRLVLQFLRRRQIAQDELRAFLGGNLRRAALERARNPHLRGPGIGPAAIEQTLLALMTTGKAPARIHRIGVIGPGLDAEYDLDSGNLFGSLEATLSLGLAKPGNVEVVVFDINPWVLSHVRTVAGKAGGRSGAHIRAEDLNIVTQTIDAGSGQGFDLIVASTSLAGHSPLDQTLALENVGQMMASGGVFLASGAPGTMPPEFEALNSATPDGIAVYRRR